MERDPESGSDEYHEERDGNPREPSDDDLRVGLGAPPAALALYVGLRRRDPFDIAPRLVWMLLAIGFIAVTAYLLAGRPPVGYLAITTVPDPTCSVEVSGYCASNPIPWADVSIDGSEQRIVVTSGADGRVLVGLRPGEYSVVGDAVGDLRGIKFVVAVVRAEQTTEVWITFTR